MSIDFEITPYNVRIVLYSRGVIINEEFLDKNNLKDATPDEVSCFVYDEIISDEYERIERAALFCDIDEQTEYAYEEIASILIENDVISRINSQDEYV